MHLRMNVSEARAPLSSETAHMSYVDSYPGCTRESHEMATRPRDWSDLPRRATVPHRMCRVCRDH
jgi:hypothetical protein